MKKPGNNDPVVIVGAGVTGCVIARELARRGYPVVVIEREEAAGGLSRTFRYGDWAFDVGPHRFFTRHERILRFIRETLRDDYTVLPRNSEVYILGRHYRWPLRPSVIFNLPLSITIRSGRDLLLMSLQNGRREPSSFEDYVKKNYGPSLYNVFFREYTQKFIGLSPRDIHAEWAKEGMRKTIIDESIASRDLFDILKLFFLFRPLKTEFIYPPQGTGVFCGRLAGDILDHGGKIFLNTPVTGLRCVPGGIRAVGMNGTFVDARAVVWTGSLKSLCGMVSVPPGPLEYLSLLLFNIELDRPPGRMYQWCYYGNEKIVFSRISVPRAFSSGLSPANRCGLCVEVTCREGDGKWNDPGALVEPLKRDLARVGMVSRKEDIRAVHIEKIADAYPVYALDFPRALGEVRDRLGTFRNLVLAGRTGLFWYNNMDDCIGHGLECADNFLKGAYEF